ncbi:hypothetical protein MUK42_07453 [Musa troglodytarum]|uniref:Uncharacterized protein n=1 Tax=Musa troglodytarum TaxID=320322 RepID=A0A9E7HWT3_9LILI|nr:hypothetical protein MUK42_07453 [Musa troglodytarum]
MATSGVGPSSSPSRGQWSVLGEATPSPGFRRQSSEGSKEQLDIIRERVGGGCQQEARAAFWAEQQGTRLPGILRAPSASPARGPRLCRKTAFHFRVWLRTANANLIVAFTPSLRPCGKCRLQSRSIDRSRR